MSQELLTVPTVMETIDRCSEIQKTANNRGHDIDI